MRTALLAALIIGSASSAGDAPETSSNWQLNPQALLASISNASLVDLEDRALQRTAAQIDGRAQTGQLLLLICSRPCAQPRKQVPPI